VVVEFTRIALLATTFRDDEIRGRQWGKREVGRNPRGIENSTRMMLRELYVKIGGELGGGSRSAIA
jgi:hypothetical protein